MEVLHSKSRTASIKLTFQLKSLHPLTGTYSKSVGKRKGNICRIEIVLLHPVTFLCNTFSIMYRISVVRIIRVYLMSLLIFLCTPESVESVAFIAETRSQD